MIHEPPYVPGPGTSLETAAELADLAASDRGGEATERFMRHTGMPEAMLEQTKASPGWPQLVALSPTLAYDVLQCNRGVVPVARLAEISCPVLASTGELSPGWASESVQMVAAAVQNGEWRLLEGQAHNVAPDVLAALAREHFVA
jgi:pimeloyl-ACP methyl ester carboxylesterase